MNRFLPFLLFLIMLLGIEINAQEIKTFKTPGTHDQYVPVLFSFNNKPFSISRPNIHQDRGWLAYGTTTISGIGFGWGSGNTKIKLENYTHGSRFSNNTGGNYSYIGKVMVEWISSGIIVYLRGNTTYNTDGVVQRNDGLYTASAGEQNNLSAVSLDEKGYNIPSGVYVSDWEINSETKSIEHETKELKEEISTLKENTKVFKTPGTYDQYVPVLFAFKNKPFSISRPSVHEDRNWLGYGIATINGIGFGWGSGNTKIKLENFTVGSRNVDGSGGNFSYIGKVSVEWPDNGIIVYLRGNTTYYTDGNVKRNDGKYVGPNGTISYFNNLGAVSLDEAGYNIPNGIFVNEMIIDSNTKSIVGAETILTHKNGNIGIGTENPTEKLSVANAVSINGNIDEGGYLSLVNYKKSGNDARTWRIYNMTGAYGNSLQFWSYSADFSNADSRLKLSDNGNMSLNGKLETKEVKVTESPTADFVFEEDYALPTLQEVEKHIKEKKHLPEIASAKEMEKEGVNVGEFQIQLLQKIEELTLYIIEQNKKIEILNKEVQDLKK